MTKYTLTAIRRDGSQGEVILATASSLEDAINAAQQRYGHHTVAPCHTAPTRWEAAVRD